MSDVNSVSIKVAKYRGNTRANLFENNEYGYCSIIKATKQVLDKLELENKTRSRITSKERIDRRLWNPIALREALINGIVHNDYTYEAPPQFEIFDDRMEITSAGSLPDLLTQQEFFGGYSIPRNQELMRIFKDMELVEHLGSGVPRILEIYPKKCFRFTENFIRFTMPNAWNLSGNEENTEVTDQATDQVIRLIAVISGEKSRPELMEKLQLKHGHTFRRNYLQPSLDLGFIEMTQPDAPNSPTQKYRLTEKGKMAQKVWQK